MTLIRHFSVAVKQPERTAKILAEMSHGIAKQFSAGTEMKAWICGWDLEKNELIEFLPHGWLIKPTSEDVVFDKFDIKLGYNSTHVQLEVTSSIESIKSIAKFYQCHYTERQDEHRCIPLLDVWLEEDFLIEFVFPKFQNF